MPNAVWRSLSRYRPRFMRQLVVGPYIVDLARCEARLVVELDGGQHSAQLPYDAAWTAWLERQGWRVIRLWNSDVMSNPEGAVQHVVSEAAECLGGTHPQPLPFREGSLRRRPYEGGCAR